LLNDRLALDVLGWRTVVTNTTFRRVPSADVLYFGDKPWWDVHHAEVQAVFKGECWTINRAVAHQAGLCHIEHSHEIGLSETFGRIHSGGNSGYAALGLSYWFGARQILLVGFDFQDGAGGESHWHGDHPYPLEQGRPYVGWLQRLPKLTEDLQEQGVSVINCTLATAIPEAMVPRGDLEDCLCRS
jgi:hypothetical protein